MTDEFEEQVSEMLRNRVADLPASYDVDAAVLQRARRRRAIKIGAFTTALVLVAVGAAVTMVGVANHSASDHVVSTAGERPSVPTVACPIRYDITPDTPMPPPSTAPRRVSVPGADAFASYAATTDERYILLGPKGWTCSAEVAADGSNGFRVAPPARSGVERGGISVGNDFLWHGGVGSPLACSVSDAPAVAAYIQANFPALGPCPKAARTLTPVDAHVTKFVDADGTRGAGWILLPSSPKAEDGKVSVLTCHPSTRGLTVEACDAIIADWIARVRTLGGSPTTTTTEVSPSTGPNAEPVGLAPAPYAALDWAATPNGMVVVGPRGESLAAYDVATDRWRTYRGPPFAGIPYILAVRSNTVFVMAAPQDATSTTPFAALDLGTGAWQPRASVPEGVPLLRGTGDADHIYGVGAFESNGDYPPGTKAVEYDVASDRWTKLPPSPLSARAGSELAWTGKELLVWSGGSNHQGSVPSYDDGAAYNPATGTWRALPTAPISGRAWAATAWTGTEMLVWGGDDCGCGKPPTGGNAAYNPETHRWRVLATAPLGASRTAAGTWTGREFIVLGAGGPREVGVAAYNPSTDTWRLLPAPPKGARAMGDAAFAVYADGKAMFAVSSDGALAAFAYPSGG